MAEEIQFPPPRVDQVLSEIVIGGIVSQGATRFIFTAWLDDRNPPRPV